MTDLDDSAVTLIAILAMHGMLLYVRILLRALQTAP